MKKFTLTSALICASLAALADGTVSYPNGWTLNYKGSDTDATIVSVATAGSGKLDMTTPTENVTVTAIRSKAFSGCSALNDITLPASLTQFEEDPTLFTGQFIGNGGKQHLVCGDFAANPDITVDFKMTDGDAVTNQYNEFGSSIFCFGANPTPEYYELGGIIQLYWSSTNNGDTGKKPRKLMVITNAGKFLSEADVYTPFSMHFEISGGHVIVTGKDSNNNAILFKKKDENELKDKVELYNYKINAFSQFSYAMGNGMTADVTIVNNSPRRDTPFANTAVSSVTIADGNSHMNVQDGALYYTGDAAPAFRPLTALGSCFTIADHNGQYFYANTECNAAGQLNTTGDNVRQVKVAPMSNVIAPATLFKINNITGNGFKIAGVNSDAMEFGGKAGNHNRLDVCVSQWSAAYLTTYLGEDSYILATSTGYTLHAEDGLAVSMDANADIEQPHYQLTIKGATSIPLTFNDEGHYAATTLPVAVSVPAGAHVYKVVGCEGTAAKLQEISGTIPANTPFVIYESSLTQIDLPVVAEAAAADEVADAPSVLRGYPTRVTGLAANSYFAFDAATKSFVKSSATSVGIGVPYILANDLPGLADDAASITLPADPTTAIREVQAADSTPIRHGIYDLQGRRLSAPVRGFNIIDGRKVYVK